MTNWLVVGLGNPGPTYANTRHNVGFMAVDDLAERAGASFSLTTRLRAEVTAVLTPKSDRLILVKPTTFMNESGVAVLGLANYYKVDTGNIVAIHDEIDLDPGQFRLKFGGGDNGHNGLKSLRSHLHTGDYFRARIGVGRPPGRQEAAKWVLAKVSGTALEELKIDASKAADAVLDLISHGLTEAQNRHNS